MESLTSLNNVNCIVCGSSIKEHESVLKIKDYPVHLKNGTVNISFQISQCKNCGMISQNPRPTEKLFQEYYEASSQFKRAGYNEGQIELRQLQKKFLEQFVPQKGKILDVGCGTGFFLDLLKKNGWDVYGVEPSAAACKIAKEDFGINIFNGFLEEFNPKELFDVVSIRHVVEHFFRPPQVIERIHGLLKEDGKIFIELQDISHIDMEIMSYFYFEHIFYFTPISITNLLNRFGFNVVARELVMNPKNSDSPYPVIRLLAAKDAKMKKNRIDSDYPIMSGRIKQYFLKLKEQYQTKTHLGNISRQYKKGKQIAIWGASWHTVFIQKVLGYDFDVKFYIDSNEEKKSVSFLGKPVCFPREVNFNALDAVIISSQAFEDEIYRQLLKLGVAKEKIARIYG